jgi:hypothetical protein
VISILPLLLITPEAVLSVPKVHPDDRLLERLDSDGFALVSSKHLDLYTAEGKHERTISKEVTDHVFSILPSGDVIGTVVSGDWIIRKGTDRKQKEWLPRENRFVLEGLFFADSLKLSVRSSAGSYIFENKVDRFTGLGVSRGTGEVHLVEPWESEDGHGNLVSFERDNKGGYIKARNTMLKGPGPEMNSVYCSAPFNRVIALTPTDLIFIGLEKTRLASLAGLDLTKFPLSDSRSRQLKRLGLYRVNGLTGHVTQVATCLAIVSAEARTEDYNRLQLSKSGKWLYLESYASVLRIPISSICRGD